MKKLIKRRGNLKWTFESDPQRFLTHLARMRVGNKAIMRRTGYTDSQITYALHQYKLRAGLRVSLRQRWANGTDPIIDELLADRAMVEAMDYEIDHKVIPSIIHPTPKTVRIKD